MRILLHLNLFLINLRYVLLIVLFWRKIDHGVKWNKSLMNILMVWHMVIHVLTKAVARLSIFLEISMPADGKHCSIPTIQTLKGRIVWNCCLLLCSDQYSSRVLELASLTSVIHLLRIPSKCNFTTTVFVGEAEHNIGTLMCWHTTARMILLLLLK